MKIILTVGISIFLASCQSQNCNATKLDEWRIRIENPDGKVSEISLKDVFIQPTVTCKF